MTKRKQEKRRPKQRQRKHKIVVRLTGEEYERLKEASLLTGSDPHTFLRFSFLSEITRLDKLIQDVLQGVTEDDSKEV